MSEVIGYLTVNQYAVKLMCGSLQTSKFLPAGDYFTAINIHNPSNLSPVEFYYKIALANPGQAGQIVGFFRHDLKPDEALEIDCPEIQQHLNQAGIKEPFMKGFVIIESPLPLELDVVAVYSTTHTGAPTETLEIERVNPRHVLVVQWPPQVRN